MIATAERLDLFLDRLARPWTGVPSPRHLALAVLIAGPAYGAVMGTFSLDRLERLRMVAYAAIKMPLLVFGTALVCLPGFFVLNSVLGLRRDFREAIAAVLAGQAALALALASLAPLTACAYVSGFNHRAALLFNAAMFTFATAAGQTIMLRCYRPLIARARAHAIMLWAWVALYAFVGIQMGWMLRPFVGTPGLPVTFFRQEPFSNAYVVIARLILGS